jgi:hypothetical protein
VLIDSTATATNRFNQRTFQLLDGNVAGSREHLDSRVMMVLLRGGVEGSAKIAMTPLLSGCAAMGLLPDDVRPRLIFPGAAVAQIC